MTTEVKVTEDAQRKFELWFFRDINDERRLSLLKLFGLPIDEIGKVHSRQRIGLKRVLRQLTSAHHQADDATVERVARTLMYNDDLDPDVFIGMHGGLGHYGDKAKAAITAMREDG